MSILLVRRRCLYCVWGVGADNELVVGGSFAGISTTDAYLVYFSWEITFGLVVGRHVFVSDFCIGSLYLLLKSL